MATQDILLDLKKMSADRSTLRYPADMAIASDTDYIQFDFFEYAPPMLTKGSGLNKQTVEDLTNTESLSNVLSGNMIVETILLFIQRYTVAKVPF